MSNPRSDATFADRHALHVWLFVCAHTIRTRLRASKRGGRPRCNSSVRAPLPC